MRSQLAAILPFPAFLASQKVNNLVSNTAEYSDSPRLHHFVDHGLCKHSAFICFVLNEPPFRVRVFTCQQFT